MVESKLARAEKRLLKREHDGMVVVAGRNREIFEKQSVPQLAPRRLKGKPDADLGRVTTGSVAGLGRDLAREGAHLVMAGQQKAWRYLWEACLALGWNFRVQEVAYERDTSPDRWRRCEMVGAFSYMLLAEHLGACDTAADIGVVMAENSRDNACSDWLQSTGMLAFMATVYEEWTGRGLGIDSSKLLPMGRYEELLSPNCVGAEYEAALTWACTERLDQAKYWSQRTFGPLSPPFTVLPIELVMWQRLRKRQGLEVSTFGHPFLEGPLAVLEPPIPEDPSEMWPCVERAIPHLREYLKGSRFEGR